MPNLITIGDNDAPPPVDLKSHFGTFSKPIATEAKSIRDDYRALLRTTKKGIIILLARASALFVRMRAEDQLVFSDWCRKSGVARHGNIENMLVRFLFDDPSKSTRDRWGEIVNCGINWLNENQGKDHRDLAEHIAAVGMGRFIEGAQDDETGDDDQSDYQNGDHADQGDDQSEHEAQREGETPAPAAAASSGGDDRIIDARGAADRIEAAFGLGPIASTDTDNHQEGVEGQGDQGEKESSGNDDPQDEDRKESDQGDADKTPAQHNNGDSATIAGLRQELDDTKEQLKDAMSDLRDMRLKYAPYCLIIHDGEGPPSVSYWPNLKAAFTDLEAYCDKYGRAAVDQHFRERLYRYSIVDIRGEGKTVRHFDPHEEARAA